MSNIMVCLLKNPLVCFRVSCILDYFPEVFVTTLPRPPPAPEKVGTCGRGMHRARAGEACLAVSSRRVPAENLRCSWRAVWVMKECSCHCFWSFDTYVTNQCRHPVWCGGFGVAQKLKGLAAYSSCQTWLIRRNPNMNNSLLFTIFYDFCASRTRHFLPSAPLLPSPFFS